MARRSRWTTSPCGCRTASLLVAAQTLRSNLTAPAFSSPARQAPASRHFSAPLPGFRPLATGPSDLAGAPSWWYPTTTVRSRRWRKRSAVEFARGLSTRAKSPRRSRRSALRTGWARLNREDALEPRLVAGSRHSLSAPRARALNQFAVFWMKSTASLDPPAEAMLIGCSRRGWHFPPPWCRSGVGLPYPNFSDRHLVIDRDAREPRLREQPGDGGPGWRGNTRKVEFGFRTRSSAKRELKRGPEIRTKTDRALAERFTTSARPRLPAERRHC